MGTRKETILKCSKQISEKTDLTFAGKEFNYGRGIGRADNYYSVNQDKHVILEIENSQRHPEMNVLKAWPYLKDNPDKEILLIQFITRTDEVSPNRVELCKWLGKEMMQALNNRFLYYLLINEITRTDIENMKQLINRFK